MDLSAFIWKHDEGLNQPATVLQGANRQRLEAFISALHGCLIHDDKKWIAFIRADGFEDARSLEQCIRFKQHVFDGHLFSAGITVKFADGIPEA
jgi:hypothetical protein